MEIVVEPELYSPSIGMDGAYIDKVPSSMKHGVQCACGSRKDKIYDSASSFSAHLKTKIHQRWLTDLNLNKANYYTECIKLQDIVKNQQLIIGRLERTIHANTTTIEILSNEIDKLRAPPPLNLLIYD
jgi:hypothetical protein